MNGAGGDLVVLGGGVAGTLTANLLARRLRPEEARITVVDASGMHTYQPGFLGVALGTERADRLQRDSRRLLHRRVHLLVDRAVRIDPVARVLHVERGHPVPYDRLVIATGARLDYGAVPGLAAGTHDFYSLTGAERLREALESFTGGDLVVGVAGTPYRCPPSPASFLLLLEERLRRRGTRDRARLHYLSPVERPLAIESAPDIVGPLLKRRDIRFHPFVNVVEVDPDKQQIHSLEGETIDYDLAILVPPHRGAAVVSDSGLGDSHGWVPTDPETLRVRAFDGLFAIGDSTDLPISKAGSTAHFEAPVVVEQIVASLRGRAPDPVKARYDGKVMCFLEVGGGKAVMLAFDYERPIRSLRPSRRWHLMRRLFDRAYWSTVPRGRF
jgi:sulfide:quinone oxidoreductase